MYRQFLNIYLTRSEQIQKNKSAAENQKFCNFICQDYRSIESFYESSLNYYCIDCCNYLILTKKYIKNGIITKEQFKENYKITRQIQQSQQTIVVSKKMNCVECKTEKTLDKFDHNRNICKDCRHNQAVERTQKDLENDFSEIEKLKNDVINLTIFIRRLSVDKLQQVTKHFKIGRKSSDKKEDTIAKILDHFKKLQNPHKCLGSCGFDLLEQFSFCENCKQKTKKETIEERNYDFKENLPVFMEELYEITKEDLHEADLYNYSRLTSIAEFLDIKVNKSTHNKETVVNMINEKLKSRRNEETTKNKIIEIQKELVFEGFTILSRDDGFINATEMCRIRNKKFNDWTRLDSTKELIIALQNQENLETGKTDSKIIDIKLGKNACSWIHPDLAVHLALWIDKIFAIKVSRFVREIAISGHATLEYKTSQQLLTLDKENKQLKDSNKRLKLKRNYHKFKKGPGFYIINIGNQIKIGFEGENVNNRFKTYRTLCPNFKLNYLVYTDKANLLEQTILARFNLNKLEVNHEVIVDVSVDLIIEAANTIITYLNLPATIETREELDKYNES